MSDGRFKKGQTPWNKGVPMSESTKQKQHDVQFGKARHTTASKKQISRASKGNKHALGYKHTDEAKKKISKPGDKHPNWLGEKVGYVGIHLWLRKTYGKASCCKNKSCEKLSFVYDWAKIREKKYERKRENFIELCRKCHQKYDRYSINITL
jgi:NUMOD3 motif